MPDTNYYSVFNDATTEGVDRAMEDRALLDPKLSTSINQLRRAMFETYEPNKLNTQTTYRAIVLAQLSSKQVKDHVKVRVKARVPQLHTLLPIPKSPKDYLQIACYPTFLGNQKDLNLSAAGNDLPAGSEIEVKFDNAKNWANPQIVKIMRRGPRSEADQPTKDKNKRRHEVTDEMRAKLAATRALYGTAGDYRKAGGAVPNTVGADVVVAKSPFKSSDRGSSGLFPNTLVIHHGGLATDTTISHLAGKGYGTHFIVSNSGVATQAEDVDRKVNHVGTPFVNQRSMGLDMTFGSNGSWASSAAFKGRGTAARRALIAANKEFIVDGLYNGKSEKINKIRTKRAKALGLNNVDQLVYWWPGVSGQACIPNQKTMERVYRLATEIPAGAPTFKLVFPAMGANHKGMFTFWRLPKCVIGTSDEKSKYNVHYAEAVSAYQKWAAKQPKYKATDPEVIAGTATEGDPKGTPPKNARKPTEDELAKGKESVSAHAAKCDHTGMVAHGHLQANRLDGYSAVYFAYLRKTGITPAVAFKMTKLAHRYMNLHKVKYAPVTLSKLNQGILAGLKKAEPTPP